MAVKPVRLLVNPPVPAPSVVWLSVVVGFDIVDQHTPKALIALPPSLVILPPHTAVVEAILLAVVVVRLATPALPQTGIPEPFT